jgi:hypothetical protein
VYIILCITAGASMIWLGLAGLALRTTGVTAPTGGSLENFASRRHDHGWCGM